MNERYNKKFSFQSSSQSYKTKLFSGVFLQMTIHLIPDPYKDGFREKKGKRRKGKKEYQLHPTTLKLSTK